MEQKVRATGIAWYRQEDYAKIKRIMIDHRKLPDTYKKWSKSANAGVEKLRAEGHIVEKVNIDPETFPSWCIANGMEVDANARMRFASDFVARKYRNQS